MTSLLKYDHLEGLVDFPRGMLRARLVSECGQNHHGIQLYHHSSVFYTKCLILKLKVMLLLNFFFSHVNLLLEKLCSSLCGSQAKRHNQVKDSRRKDVLLSAIKNSENLSQSSISPTGKVGNVFFLFWFGHLKRP